MYMQKSNRMWRQTFHAYLHLRATDLLSERRDSHSVCAYLPFPMRIIDQGCCKVPIQPCYIESLAYHIVHCTSLVPRPRGRQLGNEANIARALPFCCWTTELTASIAMTVANDSACTSCTVRLVLICFNAVNFQVHKI